MMGLLILGLVMFLGTHFLRLVAEERRAQWLARHGEKRFKLVYSLIALIGFVFLCVGFAQTKSTPVVLWMPPFWLRHMVSLLVLLACVLAVASFIPRNHIQSRLGHPLYAATKLWALSHLLVNGLLAEVILFGSFLIWSIWGFAIARRRDRLMGVTANKVPPTVKATVMTLLLGVLVFVLFAFVLHAHLFGVRPFGSTL